MESACEHLERFISQPVTEPRPFGIMPKEELEKGTRGFFSLPKMPVKAFCPIAMKSKTIPIHTQMASEPFDTAA